MPYRFIFLTWIWIMPIQIIAVALTFGFQNRAGDVASFFDPDTLAVIGGLSFLFSIPGLFGLAMLVWIAREFIYNNVSRFTFICIGSVFITMFCYVFMDFILSLRLPLSIYLEFVATSICSVLIALFLTRKSYFSYLNNSFP